MPADSDSTLTGPAVPAIAARAADRTAAGAAVPEVRGGRLRAAARLAAIAAVTGVDYSLYMVGSGLLRPWPERRQGWRVRLRRHWARVVARRLGLRWRVRGRPPERPFLMVTNHLGYTDILLLLATTGASFVAKSEIDSWPLMGHLCRVAETLMIDRGAKRDLLRVGSAIERRLAAGGAVILFAEGTTGWGDAVLPLKPSLLEPAARGDLPVWYGTIGYRLPDGRLPGEAVVWYGGAPLLPHLSRLLRLPRVEATLTFGPEPIADGDRKQLAARLRSAMQEIFERSAEGRAPGAG